MVLQTGFPAVSGITDFPTLRKLFAGDIVRDASGAPRAGVLPSSFDPIVTGRADLRVDVAAMQYITVRNGGVIRGVNDGTVQVPLLALPTANSRIDILWTRQPMAAPPTSDGSDVPLFGWTQGVASATPVRPSTALPAGALEIAQVQVAFNATATNDGTKVTITQTAPLTTFAGGIIVFRTTTEFNAFAPMDSQIAYVMQTGQWWGYNAGIGWTTIGGKAETVAFPADASLYDNYGSTFGPTQLSRTGGRVFLEGLLSNKVVYNISAGNTYVLGSVPAVWAPKYQRIFYVFTSAGIARLDVLTNGQVQFIAPTTLSGAAVHGWFLSFDNVNWADKRM